MTGDHSSHTGLSLFESVSHEHQLTILRLLVETPTATCTVDEVVDAVVAPTDGSIDAERAERVRTRLYHADLPKLADLGVVDYDWRSGDVRLTADEAAVAELLDYWHSLPQGADCRSTPSQ